MHTSRRAMLISRRVSDIVDRAPPTCHPPEDLRQPVRNHYYHHYYYYYYYYYYFYYYYYYYYYYSYYDYYYYYYYYYYLEDPPPPLEDPYLAGVDPYLADGLEPEDADLSEKVPVKAWYTDNGLMV